MRKKLVVPLAWAAAAFAPFAACSSDHHDPRWSMTPSVPAQPIVAQDDGPPRLPGCPCEPVIEVDLTVADSAGNPVDGVTFSGPPLTVVCIGADGGAGSGAEGGADAGSPDVGVTDSGDAADAPAFDGAAAEAGTTACRTWRVTFSMTTASLQVGFEVFAPGYVRQPVAVVLLPPQCCEPVPAASTSTVLKPLPACPVAYKPCTIDAGGYRDSLTCACP